MSQVVTMESRSEQTVTAARESRRGLDNITTEWSLACTVHNLRKIHAYRPATT